MEAPPLPNKPHVGAIVAVVLALVAIIVIGFFAFTNLSIFTNFFNVTGGSTTTFPVSTVTGSNLTIGYPANYGVLANYSLALINSDRANFNLSAVTLSPIQSGQEHAYSMLENGYFSHWDVQGYKPYMRYTLVNGTGAVEENVAYESGPPIFGSVASIEGAISNLEHEMVYNDSACCQNGHLFNIINPYHNRVSIGIEYNSNSVYFVEDFENYYINLNTPIFMVSNESVILQGATTTSLSPDSVIINYDPTPTPLNASVLDSEYQKPYDVGTFLGGVIPCAGLNLNCEQFKGGITVRPSTWDVTNSSVDVIFSLKQFVQEEGSGVYTIYLTQNTFASNSNETQSLTSLSIFVQT
jgi:uncharacterized protein YkwD